MHTDDPQQDEKQEYAQFLKALGAEIRAMRNEQGWTLRDMVVRHGFHLSAWQGYEAGRFGMSLPSLLRVAKALGMRPSTLLARVEETVPLSNASANLEVPSVPSRKRIGAAKRGSPKVMSTPR